MMTKSQIARAFEIANAADREGNIQALESVALWPGRPERHTAQTVAEAWANTPELDGLSALEIQRALWE